MSKDLLTCLQVVADCGVHRLCLYLSATWLCLWRTDNTLTFEAWHSGKFASSQGLYEKINTTLHVCSGLTLRPVCFQFLNTVIPYEKKSTPPSVDDLQMLTNSKCPDQLSHFYSINNTDMQSWHMLCVLCVVLYAMKEDSEKVPTLLTDYILKGKPNWTGWRLFSCWLILLTRCCRGDSSLFNQVPLRFTASFQWSVSFQFLSTRLTQLRFCNTRVTL